MSSVELRDPPPLAKRLALLASVLVLGGIGAAIMVRMQQATAHEAALAAERETAAAAANQAAHVDVVHPEADQVIPTIVLTGTLDPAQSADLAFEVGGRVSRVSAALGDEVASGALLVTLDRASIGAQQSQSAAAIGVAQANVGLLRERTELLQTLVRSGAAPERDLTGAQQQLAVAEAQLRQAEAGHRAVGTIASDYSLRAPFAGVLTRMPSGVGGVAGPGVPLARVEDLSILKLRTTVSEGELDSIREDAVVELDGSHARGTVATVVRSLDSQTRRAPVEVIVPNADGRLVAHSFVRARIQIGAPQPALRIPATSRRPNGSVLVVGADGLVAARAIEAQANERGDWLVTSGLAATDQVVLRAAAAREGTTVVAQPPSAPREPTAQATP